MPLTLSIDGRTLEAPVQASVFDCAERVGVRVPTSCDRQGKCRECIVEVTEGLGRLSPPAAQERHLSGGFRLSCCARIVSETGVVRCHTMRRGEMRIERQAVGLPARLREHGLDPCVTRDGDRVLIDGAEVARSTGPLHGLAVDIGTTTVVVRLVDLETADIVADAAFENPQRFGGSDIMARIRYDTDHGGKLLMRTLAGYVRHAVEDFAVDPATIYEAVVVGNPTMRDLFFRKSVYSIGQMPYRSITEVEVAEGRRSTTAVVETGARCLLRLHPRARVYGAPLISGHVGADAAACMLAAGLAHEERIVAIMDIGTNTELIAGNRHRIVAASCPAGPAFEGGGITCGMPALDGAIESVALRDDGTFHVQTIGGGPPQGLCGSGLVDVTSELVRHGWMNELGRFRDGLARVTLDAAHGIVFTEADVNELAQAKGANVAGLQVVVDALGIDFDDIEVFYLAGGFGRHMDVGAAQRIGLVPPLPNARVEQVGNAAIEGATLALLSGSARRELERLVTVVEHCRLESHPRFFDFFVEGCQFKPIRSARQWAE